MTTSDTVEHTLAMLDEFDIKDRIEIIANILISTGASYMELSDETELTPENIIDIVIKDRKQNGESLQNALLHQGLLMLMWLRK